MTVVDEGVLPQRTALPEGEREHTHDLVAVDLATGGVHGQAAVGVAVVRDAGVGACRDHGLLQRTEVGRAVTVVDVEAVRLGADHDDVGAGRPQRPWRRGAGRAVGAVDDDLHPVEPVGQGREQARHVPVGGVGEGADPADAGAGRPLPLLAEALLDVVLDLVGQLVAALGEELDPVVGHRVVGRREHDAEVRAGVGDQVRRRPAWAGLRRRRRPRRRSPGPRRRPRPGTPPRRAGRGRRPPAASRRPGRRRPRPRPARARRRRPGPAPARRSPPGSPFRGRRPCRRADPRVLRPLARDRTC